ncbi:hypothetical protein [Actinomadura sp. B10D3]|uniref:hypothetical protein n=1 Tax=Actinomadura sp. B10D3 TaxID=3153557 RepID=UPI00325D8F7B
MRRPTIMDIPTLLAHLQRHDTALTLPRGAGPRWDDADLHRAAHTDDAEGYALLGLAPGVRTWQRARVLLQILAASQTGLGDRARAVQARTARVLTLGLPPGHVITVLLTLRRLRANHKHTTRTALRFVLEHPGADALIAARRPALLDCFEHALGTDTARGCARRYRGGPAEDLYAALGRQVDQAARAFPRFAGTLALVLDASASMRGYGDREWAVLSQAAALRMVLSQVCDRLEVIETGGDERSPRGATDLATGLLDALGTDPDLVAVVSDGYENVYPGDLARVVAGMPRAGITTPVVFCHAMFTGSDDLTLRRPAPSLPQRGFSHQDDFAELLPWMFGHCDAGAPWLRAALHARLDDLERQADALAARPAA